jgi:hypothetical protein
MRQIGRCRVASQCGPPGNVEGDPSSARRGAPVMHEAADKGRGFIQVCVP